MKKIFSLFLAFVFLMEDVPHLSPPGLIITFCYKKVNGKFVCIYVMQNIGLIIKYIMFCGDLWGIFVNKKYIKHRI